MEPQRAHYDVVVIGAGVGGLSCAGLLAQAGYDVLLVEQRPDVGGVCFSYERDGFTVDVGPHLLSGCGPSGEVHDVLTALDVADAVEFVPVDPLARAVFPEYEVTIPAEYETFVERLAEDFPEERRRLLMLFREMEQMYREVDDLPSSFGIWDFLKVPITHPIFAKYPNKTYRDMMDEFLLDDRLKAVVASLWVYFGLPPSEISAVFWTVVMMSYFLGGGYYPRGGIGAVADALATGVTSHDGELLTHTAAARILIEDNRVTGVELEDVSDRWLPGGRRRAPEEQAGSRPRYTVSCDRVVSNADARQTFYRLVGEEHVSSEYLATLGEMEPSLSLVKVALAVDMDVAQYGVVHHDTVFYDSWDMDEVYATMRRRAPAAPCDVTVPSLTDPDLAPPGAHCVYLWNYADYELTDDWKTKGQEIADDMVAWAERIIPGLSEHIVFRDVTTPETLRQYVRTTHGSPYGWAFTPQQMGFNRLQPRTPVKGLYLAGHWTTPGAGVAGVAVSGKTTAEIIQEGEGFSLWRKSA